MPTNYLTTITQAFTACHKPNSENSQRVLIKDATVDLVCLIVTYGN